MEKPKLPPSSYNIFFQVERRRILAGTDHLRLPIEPEEVQSVIEDGRRPKPKRKHRKSHGLIAFEDLSRTIAGRWKKIDKTSLKVIVRQSEVEKQNYRVELRKWKEAQCAESATSASVAEPSVARGSVDNEPLLSDHSEERKSHLLISSDEAEDCGASADARSLLQQEENNGESFREDAAIVGLDHDNPSLCENSSHGQPRCTVSAQQDPTSSVLESCCNNNGCDTSKCTAALSLDHDTLEIEHGFITGVVCVPCLLSIWGESCRGDLLDIIQPEIMDQIFED